MAITYDRKVEEEIQVAWKVALHISILCDDLPVAYGLWQLHLVNIRIEKLQMAIKKLQMVISFDRKVG